MAAPTNLYDDLKRVLGELKTFLDQNVATIKPAINAIAAFVPQIKTLIDQLIGLLNKMKDAIANFNPGSVGADLAKVTSFTGAVTALLESAKQLLPNEAATIEEIERVSNVVGSLPSLDQIKGEITTLIGQIIVHLNSLKG